jgi:5-methylcytosine-specific restriction endonuclease McrA
MNNVKKISKEHFIKVCLEENSMARASSVLGLHFNTFKKYALEYGCYKPNQSGKGIKKNIKKRILNIEEYVSRRSVRKIILEQKLIDYKCSLCDLTDEWNGNKLILHLDHINGLRNDNRVENLRFLCPNCHSQTSTYTGKNKTKIECS